MIIVTQDPITIELGNNRKLVINQSGNKYICKLFTLTNKELVSTKGADGQFTLTITGVIDSPRNFQKITLWLGDNSAVALFNGLARKKE